MPPGGTLNYDGSVANTGARLLVPGIAGVANTGADTTSVTDGRIIVEYFDESVDAWVPLASSADGSLPMSSQPVTNPGATYGSNDGFAGTTVASGSLAAWGVVGQVTLTPEDLVILMDETTVTALRATAAFETTGGRPRTFSRFAPNLIDGVRLLGASINDVEAVLTPTPGAVQVVDSDDQPEFAELAPGEAVPVAATATVPGTPARSDEETSAAYLARLDHLDGQPFTGAIHATGTSSIGSLIAPQELSFAIQSLPVVELELVGPETAAAGTAASWEVKLHNLGSATATDLDVILDVTGIGPLPLNEVPTDIAPGATAIAHATSTLTDPGTYDASATLRWAAAGTASTFGPVEDSVSTLVVAASDRPLTISSIDGRFFHAPTDATAFTATPADEPVFAQDFPVVAFNPPAGVIPGNDHVSPATRPFTDVILGPDGQSVGTLPAARYGHAAGVGDLSSFQAVFTGEIEVTSGGPLTLSVIADDGFVLGVSDGAVPVSGPAVGAPQITPFESYPVMAAHNIAGPLATYPVTIDFPAAGRYRFELDYFTAASDSMSLVLAAPGDPGDAGGGRVFLTGHDPDFHAYRGGNTIGARRIIQQSIDYVTGAKNDPSVLLVTDVRNPGSAHSDPRLGMNAAGFTGYAVADHGSGTAGILDLHTVAFDDYDVVVVASDHGGWLRQEQLDILNQRKADLDAYLDAGGGIVAFAEGSPGAGLTTHDQFQFVPCPSIGFDQTETGFRITPQGSAIGLTESDLNGNFSHNFFPGTCGMDILDTDAQGRILSLATPGTVDGPTEVVLPTNYLLLSPPSATAPVGTNVPLTATALDAAGNPRPDVPVLVEVGGPNPGLHSGLTDAAGKATISYQGTNTGTDTAQATATIAGDPATSNAIPINWTASNGDGGGGGGGTVGGYNPGTATVDNLTPADGATITQPTTVTVGDVTAGTAADIASWRLLLRPAGQPPLVNEELATGSGDPSGLDLGTIDPTSRDNGIWLLRVEVTDVDGTVTYAETSVVIDGQLKLGRFAVTYQDLGLDAIPFS